MYVLYARWFSALDRPVSTIFPETPLCRNYVCTASTMCSRKCLMWLKDGRVSYLSDAPKRLLLFPSLAGAVKLNRRQRRQLDQRGVILYFPAMTQISADLTSVDFVYLEEATRTLRIHWKRSRIKSAVSGLKRTMTTSLRLSVVLGQSVLALPSDFVVVAFGSCPRLRG